MSRIAGWRKWLDEITHNPVFWLLAAFLVGFLIKLLTPDDLNNGKGTVYLLAIAGGIVTLVIGTLYRHREISSQMSSLEKGMTEMSEKADRRHRLRESIEFLGPAIEDDRFLSVISSLASAYRTIQTLKTEHPNCKEFIDWKEGQIFDEMLPKLSELSERRILIDDVHKELVINQDFLLKLPTNQVRAVSYEDDGFWDEPEGKKFLDAHTQMIKKKVKITRIFILDADQIVTQKYVIDEQIRRKISVRIAEKWKLNQWELEDFVIYDDKYVRSARLLESPRRTSLKHATLTADSKQVRGFIDRYDSLFAKSVDATQYYKLRIEPVPPVIGLISDGSSETGNDR